MITEIQCAENKDDYLICNIDNKNTGHFILDLDCQDVATLVLDKQSAAQLVASLQVFINS